MFYVAKKTKALISSKVPRIWPSICKSKLIRGVVHISPCVALRIVTDRAVKQVLLHSISQPFSKLALALSREVSRNGQRKRAIQAYFHSIYKLAVTVTLTPVLLKTEKNSTLTKRLEAATSELDFCKIHN